MRQIHKYPRTHHIEGSRLQPGDEDMDSIPFIQIANRQVVVEEKVDGANCGLSFTPTGELLLQSRGHFLTGGRRERHFNLFKQWATTHQRALFERLSNRYIMYGEWLYAKHTIFYDALPHYFMEFDVLDIKSGDFLSTPRRRELLAELPIVSARVLFVGKMKYKKELSALTGQSHFIRPGHMVRLGDHARTLGIDVDRVFRETDPTTRMEGLYIKVEEKDVVRERYKYILPDFPTAVDATKGHWLNRPIVPNLLDDQVDLFAPYPE